MSGRKSYGCGFLGIDYWEYRALNAETEVRRLQEQLDEIKANAVHFGAAWAAAHAQPQ